MDRHNDRFRTRAEELAAELTLEEKTGLLSTFQHPVPRLGMEEFHIGTEIARGFVSRYDDRYSTVFPQPIGLAGTFDTELMETIGAVAGTEARAYYNCGGTGELCMWGPTVDLERDPRWGRTEEAYGEDVCLAGEMTAAYTRGLAGDDEEYMLTIPSLKHFYANNNEDDRLKSDSYVPPRLKHEYYLAAFRNAIVHGKARSVMTCYNSVNGVPGLCNCDVQDILKDKWGMWFAVTDGMGFSMNVTEHGYCDNHGDTLTEAIRSGCDIMTDNHELVRKAALSALGSGKLSEADIDRAVKNVLYARLRLGQIDGSPFDDIDMDSVDTPESRKVSLRAAEEQMVLLKNDGILPMSEPTGSIAVIGPLCDCNMKDWYCGIWRESIPPAEGFRRIFPDNDIVSDRLWDIVAVKAPNGKYLSAKEDGSVVADADSVTDAEKFELRDWGDNWVDLFSVKYQKYVRAEIGGLTLHNDYIMDWFTTETLNLFPYRDSFIIEEYLWHKRLTVNDEGRVWYTESRTVSSDVLFGIEVLSRGTDRAAEIAAECGQVIYCTGNHPMQVAREAYDRKTLSLITGRHTQLLDVILANNPRTVMALISSYPYSICDEQERVPGIIYSSHAGPYLGTALAKTVKGENVPAGRLAMTWYRSELELPDITDYDIEKNGVTYMYFRGDPLYPFGYGLSYADIEYVSLSVQERHADVTVRNNSGIDADEVVQLYFTVPDSAVTRPIKKLCGFKRVHLCAGGEKSVRIAIPEHILQIYDVRCGRMITEQGTYVFMAGGSSAELPLRAELFVSGSSISDRGTAFPADSFDRAGGIRICWSEKLRRHYLYCNTWSGYSGYGGTSFRGKKSICITASCLLDNRDLKLRIGPHEADITIAASNSYEDYSEYHIPLPANIPDSGEFVLCMGIGTAVFDIRIE